MLVYKSSRYPRIQRKLRIWYIIPRHKEILTLKKLHPCQNISLLKLAESIIMKIPVLTNNLCYPRIRKKLMFCETSEQYLFANIIITCLSEFFSRFRRPWGYRLRSLVMVTHYDIKNTRYLKSFDSSLELKWTCYPRIRMLPTNSPYTAHLK